MDDYQQFKLSPQFSIIVNPFSRGFELSDHDKILMENIWRSEEIQNPKLFNGQILNLIQVRDNEVEAEFVDYKYYIAQLRNPQFQDILNLSPISISGITLAGSKILIGLRGKELTTYPEAYELVPSGGIDPRALVEGKIDLLKQFELELWEETGISVSEIKDYRLLNLIYDRKSKIYEICAELQVNYGVIKEELITEGKEYQQLMWVPRSEISSFIRKKGDKFVPFSLFLLKSLIRGRGDF